MNTPRTDAAYFAPASTIDDIAREMRKLERELAAANERIRRLEEAAREVYIDSIASDHQWSAVETRNMHALRDVLEAKP